MAATTWPGSGGATGWTRSVTYDSRSRGSDAARRLSRTVMSSNSSSDWNDRLRPARARTAGESVDEVLAADRDRAAGAPA